MAHCAAATGIPLAIIKRAKRQGCEAFHSNRVDLGGLLRFLFSEHAEAAGVDWGSELKKWQAEKERIKVEREQSLLLPKQDVVAFESATVARISEILRQKLWNEMPAQMAGLDPASGRIIGKRLFNDVMREWREFMKTWKPGKK